MEIGTPFIAVIIYSLVGYVIFRAMSLLALAYVMKNSESIPKGRVLAIFGTTMALALASGPLTWGNLVRQFLIRRDAADS